MKKLIILFFIIFIFIIGCLTTDEPNSDAGNDNNDIIPDPNLTNEYQSECKDIVKTDIDENVDFIVDGNSVIINHYNAYRNCGFEVEYQLDINTPNIIVREVNIGQYAYCLCYFDLSVTISDLSSGDYHVELWGKDISENEYKIGEDDITIQ